MADPLRVEPLKKDEWLNTVPFPESSSLPNSGGLTDTAIGQPLLPQIATDQPLGAWPKDENDKGRYDATAETVGNALGTVVHRAKQIPSYMQDRAEYLRKRFRVIRGRAVSGELEKDLREQASEITEDANREIRDAVEEAKTRAEYLAHNSPLQFIAGTAAAGFAVGFLLGLWRGK